MSYILFSYGNRRWWLVACCLRVWSVSVCGPASHLPACMLCLLWLQIIRSAAVEWTCHLRVLRSAPEIYHVSPTYRPYSACRSLIRSSRVYKMTTVGWRTDIACCVIGKLSKSVKGALIWLSPYSSGISLSQDAARRSLRFNKRSTLLMLTDTILQQWSYYSLPLIRWLLIIIIIINYNYLDWEWKELMKTCGWIQTACI